MLFEVKRNYGTHSQTRTDTGGILSPLSLPLDYVGINMAQVEGLEPSFAAPLTDKRLEVSLGYTCINLVSLQGFEPRFPEPKSSVLPLDERELKVALPLGLEPRT